MTAKVIPLAPRQGALDLGTWETGQMSLDEDPEIDLMDLATVHYIYRGDE
jgi:hypothetical protein